METTKIANKPHRIKYHIMRFYLYQSERIPFLLISLTTIAIILSTNKIALFMQGYSVGIREILVGFFTAFLFTMHLRFFDEFKDYDHDCLYYPERPIPRGLISLNELRQMTIIVIALELALNIFMAKPVLIAYGIALLFSILAAKEFFLGSWLKKRFFVYNVLHYIQLVLVLVYLYYLFETPVRIFPPLLFTHFLFTLLTILLLEWTRKMRVRDQENNSNDTYSAHLGIGGSGSIVVFLASFILLLFLLMRFFTEGLSYNILYTSLLFYLSVIIGVTLYINIRHPNTTKILQSFSFIYFVVIHILVAV